MECHYKEDFYKQTWFHSVLVKLHIHKSSCIFFEVIVYSFLDIFISRHNIEYMYKIPEATYGLKPPNQKPWNL